jgi:Protein of unknown function (DUF1236)
MERTLLTSGAIRVLLLVAATAAFAQVPVEITPEQENMIFTALAKTKVAKPPPSSFLASVGVDIPGDVEFYEIPADINVPAIRRFRYTVINNDEVVFADPATKKVVLVLRQPH